MKPETVKPEIEDDPIVRSWGSCSVIYDGDSRQKRPNPDYHPEICQTRSGKFVDVMGRPLPLDRVPEYIRNEGAPPPDTHPRRVEMELKDAMHQAGVRADGTIGTPKRRG